MQALELLYLMKPTYLWVFPYLSHILVVENELASAFDLLYLIGNCSWSPRIFSGFHLSWKSPTVKSILFTGSYVKSLLRRDLYFWAFLSFNSFIHVLSSFVGTKANKSVFQPNIRTILKVGGSHYYSGISDWHSNLQNDFLILVRE